MRTPTLAWTENLDPSKRAVYAGADGAVDPESISGTSFLARTLTLTLTFRTEVEEVHAIRAQQAQLE